jgi:hypothetical protein
MPATDGARINGGSPSKRASVACWQRDHVKALLIAEDFAADSGS